MNHYEQAGTVALRLAEVLRMGELLLPRYGASRAVLDGIRSKCLDQGWIPAEDALALRMASSVSQEIVSGFLDRITRTDRWRASGRTVIVVDPDMWEEMADTDDDDLVSSDVFGYLPYDDPFIVFPAPIVLPSANPQVGSRAVGVWVTGLKRAAMDDPVGWKTGVGEFVQCSTGDPELLTLRFVFAVEIVDADGRAREVEHPLRRGRMLPDFVTINAPLPLPVSGETEPIRFEDLMAYASVVANANIEYHQERRRRMLQPDMELLDSIEGDRPPSEDVVRLLRRTFGTVMYLCCSNADVQVRSRPAVKPRRPKGKGGTAAPMPPTVVEAGVEVGAAIRSWRYEQANRQAGTGSGGTVRPHKRRGHFHRWRIGPGRALLSQPRYLRMLFVKAARDEGRKVTVKPVQH